MPTLSFAAEGVIPTGPFATSSVGRSIAMPTIAGAVTGGCIGVAWIVGLILWFIKRRQRWNRAHKAGLSTHRQLPDAPRKPEIYIIPPDPAIIQGAGNPGQTVYAPTDRKHIESIPLVAHNEKDSTDEPIACTPPLDHHPASAPPRVNSAHTPLFTPTNITEMLPLSPQDIERSNYPPQY